MPAARLAFRFASVALLSLAACFATLQAVAPDPPERQIRERIESIRTSILAKEPEGIVRWGTPDWTFLAPDGKSYDRAAYLDRARALFARLRHIDTLETTIEQIAFHDRSAEVRLTQTMERHEPAASGEKIEHVRVRYREIHTWIETADGWRVRHVEIVGQVERTVLP